ncbi:MAG: hypothetical protein CV089_22430 [Nitrospira sp. WS110]|nr:hypothetical protein [Nitrospira sp. WS110]
MRRLGPRTAEKMRSHRDSEDCSPVRLAKPRTEQVPQLSRCEALCGRAEASEQAGSPPDALSLLGDYPGRLKAAETVLPECGQVLVKDVERTRRQSCLMVEGSSHADSMSSRAHRQSESAGS